NKFWSIRKPVEILVLVVHFVIIAQMSWSCGRTGEMEAHLANICPGVPNTI
ncbi:7172_t:CDS:1, partial [Scutellospora calospora]